MGGSIMKKTMNEFLAEVRKATLDPTLVSELEANVAEAAKAEVAVVETAEKAIKEELKMKEITKGFQLMEAISIVKTEDRVNFLGSEVRKVDEKTFLFNGRVYSSPEAVVSAAILADSKKVFSKAASNLAVKAKEAAVYGRVYGGVAVEATKNVATSVAAKATEDAKKAAGKFGQKLVDFSK